MRKNLSPQRRNNPPLGPRSNSPHRTSPQLTKIPNRSDPLLNQGLNKKNPQIRKPTINNISKAATPIPKLLKPKKSNSDNEKVDETPKTLLSKNIKNKAIIDPSKKSKIPKMHKILPSITPNNVEKNNKIDQTNFDLDDIDYHFEDLSENSSQNHFEDLSETISQNFSDNNAKFGTEEFHKDFLENIEICNHLFSPQEVQTEPEQFSKKIIFINTFTFINSRRCYCN